MDGVVVKKVIHEHKYEGIGFTGLLAIVFIILKLIDKIDWSWWWVLSPLWIPVAFAIVVILLVLIGMGIYALYEWHN